MEWAKDQLGLLIEASKGGGLSFGLRCPTCGEPVFLRSGVQRRAHFSHYGHPGKPDCENYHPSLGTFDLRRNLDNPDVAPTKASVGRGGLFLDTERRNDFTVYLRLPRLPADFCELGSLDIRTRLGSRQYTSAQLQLPQLVPLTANLPLAEVSASPTLRAAHLMIESHLARFRRTGNYFQVSSTGGRLLTPDEPLEWGETYHLLTQRDLGPLPDTFGIQSRMVTTKGEWHLYEMSMPTYEWADAYESKGAIERYIGRDIIVPRFRVYLVDPPPHHIEPDGTHVFPVSTDKIRLRRTGSCTVQPHSPINSPSQLVACEVGTDLIEVTGLDGGDFSITVDGHEAFLGRIEPCALFKPSGIGIVVDGTRFELFDAALRDAIATRLQATLTIDFPTTRVAQNITTEEGAWTQGPSALSLVGTWPRPNVTADNFGALTWPTQPGVADTESVAFEPAPSAHRLWIDGVLVRHGHSTLPIYFRQAGSGRIVAALLNSPDFAWLQAYGNSAGSD